MLNSLANHGFLPHTGRGFTREIVRNALATAVNFDQEFADFLHEKAMTTNPDPNAEDWSLETLRNHNILEHDASLSRLDYYFEKDSHTFNAEVFAQVTAFFTDEYINMEQAGNSQFARVIDSSINNPEYEMSDLGAQFALGEVVAYIHVLGNGTDTVPKNRVEYLFENEKLPYELGWKTPDATLGLEYLQAQMIKLQEATTLKNQTKIKFRTTGGFHAPASFKIPA